jgi:hypothetical protein
MVEPPSKEYLLPIVICQKFTPCLLPSINSITNCMPTINFWHICNKGTIYHDKKALIFLEQMQKSNTVLANLQAEFEYYKKGHFSCANPLLSTVVSKYNTYYIDTFATAQETDRVFEVLMLTSAWESNSVQKSAHCSQLDECPHLKRFPKTTNFTV